LAVQEVPKSFEIQEILAKGNYGTVCVAKPAGEDRLVAIKVLNADQETDAEILRRTRDEARILNRLNHPNIVHVEHLLELQGKPIVVMEYVAGAPLDALMRKMRNGLPADVALDIVSQVAMALDAAYNAPAGKEAQPMKIIHRDIKPANILISTMGDVKVVDFGIAKADFEDREAFTFTMVKGSQGFDAPERLHDVLDSPAVDVYSLGLTLVLLLAGKMLNLPRLSKRHDEVLATQLNHIRPPGLSEAQQIKLHELLQGMCSRKRTNRPSHGEVATWISTFLFENKLDPDIEGFAQQYVVPLYEQREITDPKTHELYQTLEFLDVHDGATPMVSTTQSPTEKLKLPTLEEFLAEPDWETRRREMTELLLRMGTWDPAPFVDILQRATKAKWQFWVTRDSPARVVAALEVLQGQPTTETIVLADALTSHADEGVQKTAQSFLDSVKKK